MVAAAIIAVTIVAALVQGVTGFAFAVITVPVLTFFVGPAQAAGIGAVLGLAVVITGVVVHRAEIAWKGMMKLIAVALLFLPLGVLFVSRAPQEMVLVTLGAVTAGIGFSQLRETVARAAAANRTIGGARIGAAEAGAAEAGAAGLGADALPPAGRSLSQRRSRLLGVLAAAAAGTLGGAFATPGPPIVAYLYSQIEDRRRAKADLQFFFLATSSLIVAAHAVGGTIPVERAPAFAAALPLAVVATVAGIRLSHRLDAQRLRLITDWALILLGATLIARSVLG